MSPRAGGEADKFGNRYEGIWTVRHVLYVLAGKADSITVEDFGDMAAGVEFTYRRSDSIEVHQLKRQDSGASSWTVKSLQAKGIWDNVRHHVEAGRRFHFISALPAVTLQSLVDRARRANSPEILVKDWLTSQPLRSAFDDLCSPSVFGSPESAWRLLQGFWIDWPSERDGMDVNSALAELQLEGASGSLAAAGLGELVVNNLGVCLNAARIESELARYELKLADKSRAQTILGQLKATTDDWLASIQRELLDPVIVRAEASQLLDVAQGEDKLLLLMGAAGGGKTAILHEVAQGLRANGTPLLGFRLDRLGSFMTTRILGQEIGLTVSPVTALATVAGNRDCVLVIDQLDAVSLTSGRMPDNFDAVANLVREASGFPQMRVLLACRKFDVENDYRIRELVDEKRCAHVEIGDLTDEQVQTALGSMGIDAAALSAHQKNLLRSPLSLVLLSSIADEDIALNFQTTNHLFNAFWTRKLTNCRSRRHTVRFNEVVSRLAETISARQRLSVPATALDADDLSVDADVLVSEHVLVRDGAQIAFFHESFFDYAFARGWSERRQTLVEFLLSGDQELFRRAQVRQIMNHLRELEPDRFTSDVEALLVNGDIRYHIVDVVLSLLSVLPSPTTQEWEMVADVLAAHPPFEERLWRSLSGSDWFVRLDAEGAIDEWLSSANAEDHAHALDVMVGAAKTHPDRLAEILAGFVGEPNYANWLRWIARCADLHASRSLFDLVVSSVSRGEYDESQHELWLSAYDLEKTRPSWIVELLVAHLTVRPAALALNDSLKVCDLVDRDSAAMRVVDVAATGAPSEFCAFVIPYLLKVVAATEQGTAEGFPAQDRHFWHRYPNPPHHELDDALLGAASKALRAMVEQDPDGAHAHLAILAKDRHETAQWLLYEGLRVGGERFAEWSFSLLLEGPHRFMSGYASNSVWTARQLIEATSAFVSGDLFLALESSILSLRFSWEKRNPGWYVFNLLSAMDEGRLSDLGLRRLGELRRLFNLDQPPKPEGVKSGFIGSPIPPKSAERMNDDQWLRAIAKHNIERTSWSTFTGGAHELSSVLNEEVKRDPRRFAQIALRLDRNVHPAYSDALLRGFGEGGPIDDPSVIFEAVRHIATLGQPENDRWLGWSLQKYLKVVPMDLIELVVDRAVHAVDPVDNELKFHTEGAVDEPGRDIHMSGTNSARGSAADFLGDLLFYDTDGSWTALVAPVINQLARDISIAVRSCVASLIQSAMRHARAEAMAAFESLLESGDELLTTIPVANLIAHVGYEDPAVVAPVIERMLASPLSQARELGGQLAAIAATQWHAGELLDAVLASDDVMARKGAAGICARQVPNARDMAVAFRALEQFFGDVSEDVRGAAAGVAAALRGERLRRFSAMLQNLIDSDAFELSLPQLLITLEYAPDRIDKLVIRCVQRFVDLFGSDSGDIRTGAAGDAREVGKLLIRAYVQAKARVDRVAALDALDRLLQVGAYGVAALVSESER